MKNLIIVSLISFCFILLSTLAYAEDLETIKTHISKWEPVTVKYRITYSIGNKAISKITELPPYLSTPPQCVAYFLKNYNLEVRCGDFTIEEIEK